MNPATTGLRAEIDESSKRMTPYYQDDYATIYNADSLDVLPNLTGFDLLFADPPFNVGINYGKDKDRRPDYYEWCRCWIDLGYNALNDCGTFYLMTITRHLSRIYPMMQGEFINQVDWKNVAAASSRRTFWPSYQPILVYGKTDQYHFNTYAQTRIDPSRERWGSYTTEQRGQMIDYWDDIPFVYAGSIRHKEAIIKPGTNSKEHPAQMPEGLATRILSFSCPPGGLALDAFMGTGTLLRVAKDMGIRAVGCEINEAYCELAANRMRQPRMALGKPATMPKPTQATIW